MLGTPETSPRSVHTWLPGSSDAWGPRIPWPTCHSIREGEGQLPFFNLETNGKTEEDRKGNRRRAGEEMAGGLPRGGAAARLRGAGADLLEPMARLEAAPRDWATRTGGTEKRRPTAALQPAANERCEGPGRCVAVRWRRWHRWFGQRRPVAAVPRARLGLAMADEHCCAQHPRDGAVTEPPN